MATTSGYSGTPLARKLGVKAGHRLAIWSGPADWTVPDLPDDVEVLQGDAPPPAVDVCVAFCRTPDDLSAAVTRFAEPIRPAGALWIAWPRKAAGHLSDVNENLVRDVVLPIGLVDVKVAALDHDWSGLKIVWRREHR